MTGPFTQSTSRRQVLRTTGQATAASVLAGVSIPFVHAGEDNTIRLAIVGCGGRGTGAVVNALSVPGAPTKLIAMADVFQNQVDSCHKTLSDQFQNRVDVPPERRFVGLDAYAKAMDCLKPGDIVLLTTHSAYRVAHLEQAVSRNLNVFFEKSFAPDPGGTKRVIRAGEDAQKKNLKLAAGLMCRHSVARQAMIQKIRDGEMGHIELIRAYRLGPSATMGPFPSGQSELLWQLRNPHVTVWTASGYFAEMTIHQMDECCWIKDGWPVSAQGLGGRVPNSADCSQNLDSYSVEYTFADGSKALVQGRYLDSSDGDFSTYVHGTKCAGQFSGNIHAATVHICKDQHLSTRNITWKADPEPCDPWQAEWNDFIASIQHDRPHNEARQAALSNMVALMGRAAVHGGKTVTWDEMMASDFQYCPDVLSLTADTPPPIRADASGKYPAPIPGAWKEV